MQQQKQFKVLLIGDSCADEYVYGVCERLNPEAPVPILRRTRTDTQMGMAWNVQQNLLAFDIKVYIITQGELIIKRRFIDERYNQQLLRVDIEDEIKPFDYEIPDEDFDALVISDYDKGFLTSEKIFELVEWFDGPVFIDSKKTNLPVDKAYIKINDDEYSKLDEELKDSPNLIVTKGAQGVDYQGKNYPAVGVSVFDVCGAGDTFLSALVYFYLRYGKIDTAIPYANKAAAIAVTHFGTYVLQKRDIHEICD
ncbi:MAG: ADP-heptose synthase [Bellamyvirus sp.]|nr:MAG: ADP-heptose synthase [Bellamyvirus sp.]